MAVNVTLDAIIRRYLALNRLPMHYYVPMLVIAKQGLDEMHFDTLGKVKYEVLEVDDAHQVELPDDYVEMVGILTETGDKMRPIKRGMKVILLIVISALFVLTIRTLLRKFSLFISRYLRR